MTDPAHLAATPAVTPAAAPAAIPQAAPAATPGAPPATPPGTTPSVAAPVPAAAPTPVVAPTPAVPPVTPKEPVTEPVVQTTPAPTPAAEPDPDPSVRVVPKVDGYVLPEGVPQEMAQFAFDNDMTQAQLDSSLTQFNNYVAASKGIEQQVLKTAGEELVKVWGDKADHNLSIVRRALKQNDPKGELSKVLDTTGFGNHPAVLNFFLQLGDQMQEGGFLRSSVNTPPGKKTAAQTMFGDKHPSSQS